MATFGAAIEMERSSAVETSTTYASLTSAMARRAVVEGGTRLGRVAGGAGAAATPAAADLGRLRASSGERRAKHVCVANVCSKDVTVVRASLLGNESGAFALGDAPGSERDGERRFRATLPASTSGARENLAIRVYFEATKGVSVGLHAAWVVIMCAPTSKARELETWEDSERAAEALARATQILTSRVTGLVTRSDTIDSILDVEAVPFVPEGLRTLFNRSELEFPAHLAWRRRKELCGPHIQFLQNLFSKKPYKHDDANCNAVLKLTTQLHEEQRAQQEHIEALDLFNVTLRRVDSKTFANIATFWRVPPGTMLYVLNVPGLAEQRPLVLAGDVIFLRFADSIHVEHPLTVQHVSNRDSLIYVFMGVNLNVHRRLAHVRFCVNTNVFDVLHKAITKMFINNKGWRLRRYLPQAGKRPAKALANTTKIHSDILNEEQTHVVNDVLSGAGVREPYIVWGPPGTGKTLTLVECVAHILERDTNAKILLVAPAAYAADILCSRLNERFEFQKGQLLRVNDLRRTPESVKADVRFHSLEIWRDIKEERAAYGTKPFDFFKTPSARDLQLARVVVCSCTSASLLEGAYGYAYTKFFETVRDDFYKSSYPRWSHIFVDEAAQALCPETLIPLSLASKDTAVVLAGDSKQLGPTVHSKIAARDGLRRSLLEMWMDHSGVSNGTQLRSCYRSHQDIVSLSSRMFYDGSVVSRAPDARVALPHNWDEFAQGAGNGRASRFLFYGVRGLQRREGNTSSWTNPIEAAEVVDLLASLLATTNLTPADVAVMATYRRQVFLIRKALRARGLAAIRVGTVDDFQGQEERIVFISTVVTRPATLDALDSEIGFLNNPQRFNVAISRAMSLNVVVGHPLVLVQNALWRELLKECVRRDAFRGAGAEHLPRWASGGGSIADADADESLASSASRDHSADIVAAVAAVAQLSLLGGAAADALSQPTDGYAWDDFGDEPAFRIAI